MYSRSTVVLLVFLPVLLIAPAVAQAGLKAPERRAMDITRVTGASTEKATYLEIRFGGNFQRRIGGGDLKGASLRIELQPASGPATVITDRGPRRRTKETRQGTSGRYDLVRDANTVLVLVEKLKGPVTQVEVTTLRPGARAAGESTQEGFDKWLESLPKLEQEQELSEEFDDARDSLNEAEGRLGRAEREADKTIDRIDQAQQDLIDAKSGPRAREVREELERQKKKLERLTIERRTLRNRIRLLRRWITVLRAELEGETVRQCNDGADNGDPEDTLADHPADPGCVSPTDNDEKDVALQMTCPTPGATVSPYAIVNTKQTNTFDSFVLLFGPEQFFSSQVSNASNAATPLPGNLCGNGINVTYQYVVYTDGEPLSLPDPPPGDHSICIFLRAENPQGSGNPGGQDASLRLAVGTVKQ